MIRQQKIHKSETLCPHDVRGRPCRPRTCYRRHVCVLYVCMPCEVWQRHGVVIVVHNQPQEATTDTGTRKTKNFKTPTRNYTTTRKSNTGN